MIFANTKIENIKNLICEYFDNTKIRYQVKIVPSNMILVQTEDDMIFHHHYLEEYLQHVYKDITVSLKGNTLTVIFEPEKHSNGQLL